VKVKNPDKPRWIALSWGKENRAGRPKGLDGRLKDFGAPRTPGGRERNIFTLGGWVAYTVDEWRASNPEHMGKE